MKKNSPTFISIYFVFLIVVGLIGCSEKPAKKTPTSRPPLKVEPNTPASLEKDIPEPVIVTEKTRETYNGIVRNATVLRARAMVSMLSF